MRSLFLALVVLPAVALADRPSKWALPLELRGVPNLHRVSDVYYRGAQPTAEGLAELRKLGVKTVVSLRGFASERSMAERAGLHYEHIRFKTWHPEMEDVRRFLAIVTDPANQPVFVHCQHGADRTGMMTAIYRIVAGGWNKEDAVAEMRDGGFGFHAVWQHLIRYVRTLDVASLRR